MSRIAVLADIHANPFALEAVIDDLDDRHIDEVMVGGDLVGRGPHGSAVVERIADLDWRTIRGNHEDYVLSFRRRDVPDDWLVADKWSASRWMAEEIDDRHAEFIDSLPFSARAETDDDLRLFHGSPRSYNEGIGHWTSQGTLREHFESIDESLLVCAHTHRPLQRELDDGLVVNVGSVGLPFNGDPRAQYAIFERPSGGEDWEVEFCQVPYDRDPMCESYETTGFLESGGITAHILLRELEEARPFLVPFLKWAEIEEVEPTFERFDAFLTVYDPEESMMDFFNRVRD
jgi:predicted phosphodiesterase